MRRERETRMEHGGWFRRDSIAVDTPERRFPRGLYSSIALSSARLWEVRTGAAVILVAAAYMTDPTDVNLLKRCVQISSTGWIELLPSSNLTQPHPADKTFEDRAAESGVYKFDRVDRGAFWFLAQLAHAQRPAPQPTRLISKTGPPSLT